MEPLDSDNPTEPEHITVSDLVQELKGVLNESWPSNVWVLGEFSKVKTYASSGHVYLTLKDDTSAIECVIFRQDAERLRHKPREGDAVMVHARPSISPRSSKLQLVIRDVRIQGLGERYEHFLRLKEHLQRIGWFDEDKKKDIPYIPAGIGAVVSTQGAAVRDIKRTLQERLPIVPLKILSAPAQGEGAPELIAERIVQADQDPDCAIILVCRGGGSYEELATYNEKPVIEAIYHATTPIITGIGHESDETIADYVADYRAATPTAAAVKATPITREEMVQHCTDARQRLSIGTQAYLEGHASFLEKQFTTLKSSVNETIAETQMEMDRLEYRMGTAAREHANNAAQRLQEQEHNLSMFLTQLLGKSASLDQYLSRLGSAARRLLADKKARLRSCRERMQLLDPRRTLERGYALVSVDSGRIATSAADLPAGTQAAVSFADGAIAVTAQGTHAGGPLADLEGSDGD